MQHHLLLELLENQTSICIKTILVHQWKDVKEGTKLDMPDFLEERSFAFFPLIIIEQKGELPQRILKPE